MPSERQNLKGRDDFPTAGRGCAAHHRHDLDVGLLKDEKPKVVSMAVPIIKLQKGIQAPKLGKEWG